MLRIINYNVEQECNSFLMIQVQEGGREGKRTQSVHVYMYVYIHVCCTEKLELKARTDFPYGENTICHSNPYIEGTTVTCDINRVYVHV